MSDAVRRPDPGESAPAVPFAFDVETTRRLMDVADQLRNDEHEHRELVGSLESANRERIREHLLRVYAELDESIDPELIDQAIDTFLAEQHRFQPPAPGWSLSLAKLYVQRGAIGRRYGLPIGSVVFAFLVAGVFSWQVGRFTSGRAERAVEDRVVDLYHRHQTLNRALDVVEADPLAEQLSEEQRSRLDRALATARSESTGVASFLGEYAPGGDAAETVTPDNYEAVRALSEEPEASATRAASSLVAAEAIVEEVRRLAELAPESDQLLETIRAIAIEPRALTEAVEIHAQARAFQGVGNLDRLEDSVVRLRDLEAELQRDYRVVIDGGVWRYQNDNPNVRNYYLRVHAIGADGSAFSFRIRNEENGEVATVSEWAERVDKSAYDRVAADKQDNGLIDEDTFATKARGYLTVDRAYRNLGQLTRW